MRARLLILLCVLLPAVTSCGGDPDPFGAVIDTSSTTRGNDTTTTGDAGDTTTTTGSPDDTTTTAALSGKLEQIATSGVLRVGIYADPVLPLADPGTGTGFEPDLARELAARLLPGIDIEFVPLTAAERIEAVQGGTIDMLIRGTSHTTSREELVAFTDPYLLEGLAVIFEEASGFTTAEDLRQARLVVAAGTTTEIQTEDWFDAAGIQVDLIRSENPRDVFANGDADGYVGSWIWGTIAVSEDSGLDVMWLGYPEPIAVALPVDAPGYRTRVNRALREIITDGTWEVLAARWFPVPIPWTIREMLDQPPVDR